MERDPAAFFDHSSSMYWRTSSKVLGNNLGAPPCSRHARNCSIATRWRDNVRGSRLEKNPLRSLPRLGRSIPFRRFCSSKRPTSDPCGLASNKPSHFPISSSLRLSFACSQPRGTSVGARLASNGPTGTPGPASPGQAASSSSISLGSASHKGRSSFSFTLSPKTLFMKPVSHGRAGLFRAMAASASTSLLSNSARRAALGCSEAPSEALVLASCACTLLADSSFTATMGSYSGPISISQSEGSPGPSSPDSISMALSTSTGPRAKAAATYARQASRSAGPVELEEALPAAAPASIAYIIYQCKPYAHNPPNLFPLLEAVG
mmetsp:Transcript_35743/g.83704  ORF Transcript_35743/g.83704 Transcript_35743/m.83704 type:complete len:321 (+) Transcript_35743:1137-2099(+)